jgi:hypothetical protein
MKTSLMALRAGRAEHTPEAEPVLVDTDTPGVVRLVLDDGDVVELDATELLLAVASTQRQAA